MITIQSSRDKQERDEEREQHQEEDNEDRREWKTDILKNYEVSLYLPVFLQTAICDNSNLFGTLQTSKIVLWRWQTKSEKEKQNT